MKGRLVALWLLGTAFVLTVLRRLFLGRDKLSRFAELYGSEGLLPVSEREHEILTLRYRCTACGACDREEKERIARSRVGYRGMMATVLGGSRSLVDAETVRATLVEVPEEAVRRAEAVCPENVPIVRLVELIRGHAARQQAARGIAVAPGLDAGAGEL